MYNEIKTAFPLWATHVVLFCAFSNIKFYY